MKTIIFTEFDREFKAVRLEKNSEICFLFMLYFSPPVLSESYFENYLEYKSLEIIKGREKFDIKDVKPKNRRQI